MSRFQRQPDQTLAVLGIMRDLVERGHGYEACGVRGWTRALDVSQLVEVFYWDRRYLGAGGEMRMGWATRGYYSRIDVSVEGATPVWIYRIRNEAARLLNAEDGRPHVPIAPPTKDLELGVWMPDTVPAALAAMRWAAEHDGETIHVPGEPEWRSSLELTTIVMSLAEQRVLGQADADESVESGDKDEPPFQPGDLRWLVKTGLSDVRRQARTPLYRISVMGVNTRPLLWHGPTPDWTPRPK